ncbi:MAG: M15 family metallopeptidase [Candidatus Babeliales bacterium]|nr:M15 family metallopeptidase [Candidatus Babeliales bacterium]
MIINIMLFIIDILTPPALQAYSEVSKSMTEKETMILITDPRVLQIRIIDNKEEFIDLKNQTEIAYGSSPEIPNNQDYTKIRKTVYNKLIEAQKMLPQGLRFCLYEAHRSLSTQKKIFDIHYNQLKDSNPGWDKDRCFNETTKLASPVINRDGSNNIPPHSTGAAIDIYLIDNAGNIVDMGICVKDWLSDVTGELSATNSNEISEEAKKHRKIMSEVLEAVGFVNYPTEYWHWSYGDRYWAYHKQSDNALYGMVTNSEE